MGEVGRESVLSHQRGTAQPSAGHRENQNLKAHIVRLFAVDFVM